mmetsp:Transcript_56333/g.174799  ORF Transcript_56333/g.174799 Transcript_56333/m.174799 type:complete len:109 (-) Transcript_56333:121-447(-)
MCFSRETLRQNKVLRIRKNLVFHCLDKFDELAEKRDDYQKFHDQFGKLSVHEERHILRVSRKNLDKKCSEAFAEIPRRRTTARRSTSSLACASSSASRTGEERRLNCA